MGHYEVCDVYGYGRGNTECVGARGRMVVARQRDIQQLVRALVCRFKEGCWYLGGGHDVRGLFLRYIRSNAV